MTIKNIRRQVNICLLNLAKRKFYFLYKPFPSIISNDCFGGEIYRSLNIPYNTPFIGLMLMAPCYLKLLKNLKHYLNQDLCFVQVSKYESINIMLKEKGYFPIATIGNEIEIQFLHYESEKEARGKWETRKKRVDRKNLFVKFDFSKDYSSEKLLDEFLCLEYDKKIAIGSSQLNKAIVKHNLVDLPEYSTDGTALFRLSLKHINYSKLFMTGVIAKPSALDGFILSRFLNNGLGA